MNTRSDDNDDLALESVSESMYRMQESQEHVPVRRRPTLETAPPRAPRIFCVVLLASVIGLITWETGATLIQHNEAATDEDWKKAAEKVRAERKPTEPVLFAPHWADPMGRAAMGPSLELDMLTLSDVDRYPRVWQLSIRGKRHPWLEGLSPSRSFSEGQVRVDVFDKEPAEVLFDFTRSMLKAAKVERQGRDLVQCPLRNKRFRCDPRQGWNWAGPHLAEVGHRPYRCIFVHPVDRHVMRVKFPAVKLGRSIVVYTGIDDFENRKRAKLPVQLTVTVNRKPVGSTEHKNDSGWQRYTADTSRYAGQTHEVSFEVAAKGAFARTFCFSAEARK